MGYSIPAISGQPQQMLCITIHIDDTKYVVQTCARKLMFQRKSVVFVSINTGHGQQDFVSIAADLITNVTLSAKTSLMLGVHKAGFRREGHKC